MAKSLRTFLEDCRREIPNEIIHITKEVDPAHYDERDFVRIAAERGDVLFFSSFLIHRSGQHGREGVRLSISARYENAAETTFIERLYPFAQKRVVQRELIVKDFPSREQVVSIYRSLPQSK